MTYTIRLQDIGRKNINKTLKIEGSLNKAEKIAFQEVNKYLVSSEVSISKSNNNKKMYYVYSGFKIVGYVFIEVKKIK